MPAIAPSLRPCAPPAHRQAGASLCRNLLPAWPALHGAPSSKCTLQKVRSGRGCLPPRQGRDWARCTKRACCPAHRSARWATSKGRTSCTPPAAVERAEHRGQLGTVFGRACHLCGCRRLPRWGALAIVLLARAGAPPAQCCTGPAPLGLSSAKNVAASSPGPSPPQLPKPPNPHPTPPLRRAGCRVCRCRVSPQPSRPRCRSPSLHPRDSPCRRSVCVCARVRGGGGG